MPNDCNMSLTRLRWRTGPLLAVISLLLMGSVAGCSDRSSSSGTETDGPPVEPDGSALNVVLLYVDDMNSDLGTFGHPVVQTPNLDRLAARGVKFTAAYCPSPVCNPSRVSTLTGQRPNRTGVWQNDQLWRDLELNGVPLLPLQFKRNGYAVKGAGKLYHKNYFHPDIWDESYADANDKGIKFPRNPTPEDSSTLYWGPYRNGPDGELGKLKDTKHTDRLLDMLGSTKEPFFLALGFKAPHRPLIYPEHLESLYDADRDVPPMPKGSQPPDEGVNLDPKYEDDKEAGRRDCTVAYWRTLTYVDLEIGRILDALNDQKLWDRTVVVFVSDHGWSPGLHGMFGKKTLYEESARSPLLLAAPGVAGGQTCGAPVELIDLYPSLMELCDLPQPDGLGGRSLVPLLEDPDCEPDRTSFCITRSQKLQYMARGRRFKLMFEEPFDRVELYDLESDPGELQNLAGVSGFEAESERLRALVEANGLLQRVPDWSPDSGE